MMDSHPLLEVLMGRCPCCGFESALTQVYLHARKAMTADGAE